MTDKEKIRAEIERLYNQSLEDGNRQADRGLERAASASYGKSKVCKELLSFIDSMQEEPTIPEIVDEHRWEMLGEEPVSEDLDSFAIKYALDKPYPVTVCQAVKAGARWQKEHLWKPSEEMLEALYRIIPENVMEKSEDEMLLDKLYQGLKYGRVLSNK